jgi:hypothetical protein
MDKDSTLKSVGSAGLAVIEKFWEAHWILRFAQAVLFADLALLYETGHGIIDSPITGNEILSNFNRLLVYLLAFGLLSSIIFPIFSGLIPFCVHRLYQIIISPIVRWFVQDIGSSKSRYERPYGCVTDSELLNLALEEKSSFLLDMYNDERQKRMKGEREDEHQRNMAGQVTFPVVVLSFVDYLLPSLPEGNSIIRSASGEFWNFILIVLAFLAFLALIWAWFSDLDYHTPHWIYYPPLYKKIKEEHRAGTAEREAIERQVSAKVEEERRAGTAEMDASARGSRLWRK